MDISWTELIILAVVVLIFVGPKELPAFLRTLGRYAGMVQRQAAEFRSHFDAAMREAELDALKKDVEDARREASNVMRGAMRGLPSDKEFEPKAEVSRLETVDVATPAASNENSPPSSAKPPSAPAPDVRADGARENVPKSGA